MVQSPSAKEKVLPWQKKSDDCKQKAAMCENSLDVVVASRDIKFLATKIN